MAFSKNMLRYIFSALPAVLYLNLNLASPVQADNPVVQTLYTTDPAPLVYNNTIYLFTGHDEDGSTNFNMRDWRLFTSSDMSNWQDHGVIMNLATFSWASERAWAGQVIARNNKFYYYVPVQKKSGSMAIGVAVSDNILGPYKDALNKPLVENNEIDPTVYIDDNGQAYLYWGNPGLWYAKLNTDMISITGGTVQVPLTTAGFGARRSGANARATSYEEGPWIYKRENLWYLVYAANCCSEDIRYSTGPSITGPWTYRGVVMATAGKSFTNHPAVIEYKGGSYFFYHNGALPGGSGYTRSVAVEKFSYNSDGTIPSIGMTSSGPPMIGTLNPYTRQEAETIAFSVGLKTETCSEGGMAVSYINNNDYIKVKGVAFGTGGAKSLSARVSSAGSGGKIEVRLGSTSGTLVGTCTVASTGGWQTWTTVTCPISGATGTQDLFFKFTGSGSGSGSDSLFNFNWWQFTQS
jgi:arabinoxylan arabinofuranohydrolase